MEINNKDTERTFETRLLFLASLFNDLYTRDKIMASCIQHKLKNSYNEYLKDIHKSIIQLYKKDPLAVLKKIDF